MRGFTQKVTNEVAKSVGRNQTFLTSGRMYKPENTVHDRKFSIRLSIDAYLYFSPHLGCFSITRQLSWGMMSGNASWLQKQEEDLGDSEGSSHVCTA